jgi:putative endonuclease
MTQKTKADKKWYVYILKCADNTLYTGVTTDLERRVNEHNHSPLGAKYTKPRRPVNLIYKETHTNRSEATKREVELKKMPKAEKQRLFAID